MGRRQTGDPLVCPQCGREEAPTERFCPDCGLPLISPGPTSEAQLTEAQRTARKIKPQYAEGRLVRVAGARHQAEAEFIQGLLLEEGIPSTTRRAAGFDVPDFLAAGPRDVLVAASGRDAAREVLLEAELGAAVAGASASGRDRPARVLAGLALAIALVAVIAWIGTDLIA
ncbi:MAG: hypothetical protein U0S48_14045 [Solirubrobacteraceae bacterium]